MKTALSISLSFLFTACSQNAADTPTLNSVQSDIVQALPDVPHISRAVLAQWQESRLDGVLILDTRPMSEYAVSHIYGALQVDPKTAPSVLLSRFDVRGKDVVLYCSVGWRSSLLGDASRQALLAAGAKSVSNLEGGLFGWHNDGRALMDASGLTMAVHPYDKKWGQLIKNTEAIRYTP